MNDYKYSHILYNAKMVIEQAILFCRWFVLLSLSVLSGACTSEGFGSILFNSC